MRKGIRVIVLSLLGLLSTAVLGALTALMAAVSLAATALIVPGTGTPNANVVGDYRENFRDYYMQDTPCTDDTNCAPNNTGDPANEGMLGINYPATFWPIPLPGWCPNLSCDKFDVSVGKGVDKLEDALQALQGLGYEGDIVIAGYSQGARVATIQKYNMVNGAFPDLADQLSFVFIGNPNRPNGGILSRFAFLQHIPILDVTTGQPTPTGLPDYPRDFPTEDWAIRWEGIADWPQYLFNPLAVLNSILGFTYDHGTYLAINQGSDPGELPAGYDVDTWREITSHPELYPEIVDIQTYGDTTYYTVTPKVLPLVRPLHSLPFIGKPIADLIEPALRVIIEETGYNRNIPFGQFSPTGLIPFFNPITLALKLIPAIFQGINNFLANFGLATEIPLSPTTPVSAPPQTNAQQSDEPELARLMSNDLDGSSTGKLTLVQGNGDVKQEPAGDGHMVATNTGTDGVLTQPEGTETPVLENADKQQQTVVQQVDSEIAAGGGVGEVQGNEDGTVVAVDKLDESKDPEENTNPVQNRVDANGGSVSLSFSPGNTPGGATTGGEGAEPSGNLTKNPEPADGPENPGTPAGADDSKESEPAAA
ncbi:PE-PPE domain-containing protein [Mycolicibacterium novocastrense]|nr:PE-PPE domain-containing protein [Mycolicibacterium novocastrense]